MSRLSRLCLFWSAFASTAAAQVPPADRQIAAAVSAAPEPLRAGATVLGYSNYHHLVTLREGTNDLICLADDPAESNFHVACYQRDLEPFMARGRALRAEGRTGGEVESVRLAEIRSGVLKMPDHPSALYSLTGRADSVDPATGIASGAEPLYVIYLPYATPQSTGLSTVPVGGQPWLMYPGLPWAHIMIMK